MKLKPCTRCKQTKPLTDFSPRLSAADGRTSQCRACSNEYARSNRSDQTRAYSKEWQRQRARKLGVPEKRKVKDCGSEHKQCFDCLAIKLLDDFSPSKMGKLGRAAYCRPCLSKRVTRDKTRHAKRTQNWRLANRDKYLIQHRTNQVRRRFKQMQLDSGLVTTAIIKSILDCSTCSYCRQEIEMSDRSLDHVIPLNLRGPHHPDNLVMACRSCNSSKSDRLLHDWPDFSGDYSAVFGSQDRENRYRQLLQSALA